LREAIEGLGLKVFITDTIMQSLEDRKRLADDVVGFCKSMSA